VEQSARSTRLRSAARRRHRARSDRRPIVFVTGAGFDFGGYVQGEGVDSRESQVAAHYDIISRSS
jgi:hypothetical protein